MSYLPRTRREIDALPTILDVVEMISTLENQLVLPEVSQVPSPPYNDEGRFWYMSDDRDRRIVHLMPTSQSTFTYYRGQSQYHAPCVPTLYRRKHFWKSQKEKDIAYNRLKICEFARLLDSHPVYREVGINVHGNATAMAQHYGFATDYIDVTNSKWVAAFFGCTGYDWATDTYYPVGRDFKDGYGVMYISDNALSPRPSDFFKKNSVIGYQYFARPTKQSSFGFKLAEGEDLNKSPYFKVVFFRHDIEASTVVFNMSYNQRRFIPNDTLSKLARRIIESNEVSRSAILFCHKSFYKDKDSIFLDKVCASKGLSIREDDSLIASFTEEELAAAWKEWEEFGREDLNSRILPIMRAARFDSLDS